MKQTGYVSVNSSESPRLVESASGALISRRKCCCFWAWSGCLGKRLAEGVLSGFRGWLSLRKSKTSAEIRAVTAIDCMSSYKNEVVTNLVARTVLAILQSATVRLPCRFWVRLYSHR